MNKKIEWLVFVAALWAWDRHNRSQMGGSAIDRMVRIEGGQLAAMNGTNFTASLWDPVSGQPAYMFGAIDAPGGAGITATDYSGAFGHM